MHNVHRSTGKFTELGAWDGSSTRRPTPVDKYRRHAPCLSEMGLVLVSCIKSSKIQTAFMPHGLSCFFPLTWTWGQNVVIRELSRTVALRRNPSKLGGEREWEWVVNVYRGEPGQSERGWQLTRQNSHQLPHKATAVSDTLLAINVWLSVLIVSLVIWGCV